MYIYTVNLFKAITCVLHTGGLTVQDPPKMDLTTNISTVHIWSLWVMEMYKQINIILFMQPFNTDI